MTALDEIKKGSTQEEIAAAWSAWQSRHGGKLGPGPAFVEAINAALALRLPTLESLQRENEALRQALKPFAEASVWDYDGNDVMKGDRPAHQSDIDLMDMEGNNLTVCDLFDARDALARSNLDEPAITAPVVTKPPFEFDRYINGALMAEGVRIEKVETLEKAMVVAAKVASRGPNGEVPVLIMRARTALASTGGEHAE